jgi:hypothetical protein
MEVRCIVCPSSTWLARVCGVQGAHSAMLARVMNAYLGPVCHMLVGEVLEGTVKHTAYCAHLHRSYNLWRQ